MSFEADLKSHLNGDSAITALIGDRLTPGKLESDTLPGMTYQHISGLPATDLSGDDGEMINYRLQIVCWAARYMQCHTLAEAVRERLKTAASTFKAVPISVAQDIYEPDTRRFGVYLDFSFWYRSS